ELVGDARHERFVGYEPLLQTGRRMGELIPEIVLRPVQHMREQRRGGAGLGDALRQAIEAPDAVQLVGLPAPTAAVYGLTCREHQQAQQVGAVVVSTRAA